MSSIGVETSLIGVPVGRDGRAVRGCVGVRALDDLSFVLSACVLDVTVGLDSDAVLGLETETEKSILIHSNIDTDRNKIICNVSVYTYWIAMVMLVAQCIQNLATISEYNKSDK